MILLTKTLCFAARRGKLPRSLPRLLICGDGSLSRRGGRDLREKKRKCAAPARETDARKNREKDDIGSARKRLLDIFAWWDKKERADFHQLVLGGGRWIRLPAGRPFRGSDAPPAHHSLPLPFESTGRKEKPSHLTVQRFSLVGEGGFEPPKSLTTDLQSAPFGHSGIPPYAIFAVCWWSW